MIFISLVLVLGLTAMEPEDAIFENWIERGSRVHAERDFVNKHYHRVLSRVEAVIGLPKGHSNFLNEHTLADYLTVGWVRLGGFWIMIAVEAELKFLFEIRC